MSRIELVQDKGVVVNREADVTVTEMMRTVAKAYLVMNAQDGHNRLKRLVYPQLVNEYHWALVTLDRRGLLTPAEQQKAALYASEFLNSSPLALAMG